MFIAFNLSGLFSVILATPSLFSRMIDWKLKSIRLCEFETSVLFVYKTSNGEQPAAIILKRIQRRLFALLKLGLLYIFIFS